MPILKVYSIVTPNPYVVYNMFEIPTYQNIGIIQCGDSYMDTV
jgi:hypothetical protein